MPRLTLLLVLAAASLAGCKADVPNQERPYAVILAGLSTHQAAAKLAESLSEKDDLKGAVAVTVADRDGDVRHLVVSRAFASEDKVEAYRLRLEKKHGVRLTVLDVRIWKVVDPEAIQIVSPPEDAERLERLAELLPDPGAAALQSLLMRRGPGSPGQRMPGPAGRASPRAFSDGFAALGFSGTAEAVYRTGAGKEDVRIFIGLVGQGADAQAKLREVYSFLHARSKPKEAALDPQDAEGKGSASDRAALEKKGRKKVKGNKKKIAKRKRAGPKRAKKALPKRKRVHKRKVTRTVEPPPADAAEPIDPTTLVPVAVELPPAQKRATFWGQVEVHALEQVAFVGAAAIREKTRLRSAWACLSADGSAVVMVVFDNSDLLERLMLPMGLGAATGLANSPWLGRLWAAVPEVGLDDEKLAYVGMEPLAAWAPKRGRNARWADQVGAIPVFFAGLEGPSRGWQLSNFIAPSTVEATTLFEQAYVEPRKEEMQRVLNAKKVKYDVGVNLREVGDITAWHLMGAARGRLQDLYFQRGRRVWLVRGSMPGPNGLSLEEFVARVEMLQIWDRPALP